MLYSADRRDFLGSAIQNHLRLSCSAGALFGLRMGLFENFDFSLLDDPEFGEDSVREELIVPLLVALGYTASPPYRIIRSRKLEHPYVYFGTIPKHISIIPDYLLERDGLYAWILDAKNPRENIDSGKNVEQAYSYAMHRDIRVELYGLCNGRKLVVYHVSRANPVLEVSLEEIDQIWPIVLKELGCKSAWPDGLRPDFHPDMGLGVLKAGLATDASGKPYFHLFTAVTLIMASKLTDELYSVGTHYSAESSPTYIATFDFGSNEYAKFLVQLPSELRQRVRIALSRQPYTFCFDEPEPVRMTVVAHLGPETMTNSDETYHPFIAEDFIGFLPF